MVALQSMAGCPVVLGSVVETGRGSTMVAQGTRYMIMAHFVAPCVLALPAEWNLFLNISKGLFLAEHLLLSVVCYSSPNTNFAIPKLSDFLPKGPSIAEI